MKGSERPLTLQDELTSPGRGSRPKPDQTTLLGTQATTRSIHFRCDADTKAYSAPFETPHKATRSVSTFGWCESQARAEAMFSTGIFTSALGSEPRPAHE